MHVSNSNLTWKDITARKLQEYFELEDSDAQLRLLITRKRALMERMKYYAKCTFTFLSLLCFALNLTIRFCKSNNLPYDKTSCLFSIIKATHNMSTGSNHDICLTFQGKMSVSLSQSFSYFKSILVDHSVDRPPWSVQIFSLEDVKLITDYVVNTYYRHYKLYTYVFNKRHFLNFNTQKDHLEPTSPIEVQELKNAYPPKTGTKDEEVPASSTGASKDTDELKTTPTTEEKNTTTEEKLLNSNSSAPKTPLDKLTMHVETIASQSAAMIVQEHMSHLKEELERQLKQHEEQLLLKVQKLVILINF